ncbi:hypothetical protein [Acidaminococcus massiliensis]|uniref:hypothetical protein n=1 Tax=Acidaminococcus massiliensis TaxID=1852375 RepID=UPI00352273FA
MDFIVSEFINLIKGCSNGLALEKEVWRRGIELQSQAFARALEIYDAELARQYVGKQEILRIDQRTVLCMFGTVTFSRRLVRREGGEPSRVEEYRGFLPSGRSLRFCALHSALSAP